MDPKFLSRPFLCEMCVASTIDAMDLQPDLFDDAHSWANIALTCHLGTNA